MSARKRVTFWLDDHHMAALKAIKERDGIPQVEQIRRAIDRWIEERKWVRAETKHGGARRKGKNR